MHEQQQDQYQQQEQQNQHNQNLELPQQQQQQQPQSHCHQITQHQEIQKKQAEPKYLNQYIQFFGSRSTKYLKETRKVDLPLCKKKQAKIRVF